MNQSHHTGSTSARAARSFVRTCAYAACLCAAFFAFGTFGPSAFAQPEADTVEARDTSFQPSAGASTEQIPGGTLLLIAYIVSFAAFEVFLVSRISVKQSAVDARLEELSTQLGTEKDSE